MLWPHLLVGALECAGKELGYAGIFSRDTGRQTHFMMGYSVKGSLDQVPDYIHGKTSQSPAKVLDRKKNPAGFIALPLLQVLP
ncbi:hypothetical protein A3H38_01615 [candidate division WOR-1 bacterium RIFCSPLOWO2_02_FULL_46_20]|uniref:Uncharacterized protein n=2 Tax=Saganbacteria TaxID=1703751 RepID=A0A1F4RH48_UNCSA|nr:MAG: hypothetical protein A3J44_03630 [candidate division WOR-1 bacterium RIFCSPHIGHO2_02_FULL_45_12]OGC07488.1 MAG: hypothetical protein A3H38_01615 [candidate division WOR-1 bacterium RIFCSPLOWO2_02_FULL_46_20]OGC09794.1 MAG: hypothetical protein A3F86_05840 [candidate division WOR-1 bacterium RIFCSPLOWO2_12_FULL_45_9]